MSIGIEFGRGRFRLILMLFSATSLSILTPRGQDTTSFVDAFRLQACLIVGTMLYHHLQHQASTSDAYMCSANQSPLETLSSTLLYIQELELDLERLSKYTTDTLRLLDLSLDLLLGGE